LVEISGDERLIFSTDYLFSDSKYPHAVDTFDKLPSKTTARLRPFAEWWRSNQHQPR
jgi:hypothetical protein